MFRCKLHERDLAVGQAELVLADLDRPLLLDFGLRVAHVALGCGSLLVGRQGDQAS